MLATISSSRTAYVAVAICCCRVKSSVTEAAKASELVFSIEIVSFPVGGMITRIAWGSTMRCITSRRSMPRAWAASVWPCSTEMIPARTISAIYAASFKPSPSVAAMNGVISVLVLTCHQITPFMAATLGLGLNEAAYMAEIVRAGIISVEHGQTEAAQALGMDRLLVMQRIVLPQAMRVIIPPTGNETISMLKTSSLAFAASG